MQVAATSEQNARLLRLATYASVATASVLIAAKVVAWLWTDSVSLLASLVDSTLDVAASIINLMAVRHALQPADAQHRFGHGKAESLAGLGQATFIAGSAGFIFLQAIGRLFHPQVPQVIDIGIGVMCFSILATLALVIFQSYVVRETGSTAIKADSLHYKTDLLMNASVIVALILSVFGWPGFDPLIAMGIVVFILYSAWQIAQEAIQHLMDHELPQEERTRIREVACSHPKVRGMHDLRTRRSGTTSFIQMHVEMDDHLTLIQAHEIADEVEEMLLEAFPGSEVIIHEDPASLIEPQPDFAVEDQKNL